ncbi:CheB methylesterase [Gloeothece citriformis PCC 7424]|uniref:protein-glutamate methylesterase n=1 Tax=Gloeothece citriformis (strain PCC 7424) TaxID=65393 RepID=B7K771_GLOC7|nr:chemotaxis protein CheB [Gloeothece citriformis]ACK69639.1 CheB methylesterase [Gloeothece citriformis PCC 7424]
MLGRIIVIGASAGGVEALRELVAGFPSDLPATIFIVLHISPNSGSVLPSILTRAGVLEAVYPENEEVFQPGRIYVAPPDHHLLVKLGKVELTRGPKENRNRPAIDVLFRSAARAYDSLVIGVVLSGLLDDGTAGLLAIKQRGGIAIVQDPEEALYSSMPRNAIENVEVDQVLSVKEIAKELTRLVYEPIELKEVPPVSKNFAMESDMATLEPEAMQSDERPGIPSGFACPDCGGVLWELNQGNLLRFRCRTGHAFSVESLLAQQSEELEEALWVALRTLEETANLRDRMAQRATQAGHTARARIYDEDAQTARQRALLIRKAILNGLNGKNKDQLDEA